jgi:hypothetical protein
VLWPTATVDENHLIVHGELEISKFTVDGQKVWSFGGRDIFTGTCSVDETGVVVTDFNGQRYRIELERGAGSIVESPARA